MSPPGVLFSPAVLVAAGAIGFNYSSTMAIIFVNKLLFTRTAFPVLSLTAAHLFITACFTRGALAAGVFKARESKIDRVIFLVALLQGAAIALGQASLKLNSVSFFQLTKQMQVTAVATIEYFALGRTLTRRKIGLLIAMTFGVCLANVSDVRFTILGAIVAIAGTASTSFEIVLYSNLQQQHGWETLQLLYITMPYCTAFMTVIAMYVDADAFGSTGGGAPSMDSAGVALFAASCALGMCVNVSSCFVGGKASALAYAMLGLAKTITVLLLGVAFFDGVPTWRVGLGTSLALVAIGAYASVSLAERERATREKNTHAKPGEELLPSTHADANAQRR